MASWLLKHRQSISQHWALQVKPCSGTIWCCLLSCCSLGTMTVNVNRLCLDSAGDRHSGGWVLQLWLLILGW